MLLTFWRAGRDPPRLLDGPPSRGGGQDARAGRGRGHGRSAPRAALHRSAEAEPDVPRRQDGGD